MVSMVGYIFSLLKLILSSEHLLMFLLTLEGSSIMVMGSLIINMFMGLLGLSGLMMFMVVMVSEGVLGLGILVMLVRGVGEDKFYFFSMM